MLRDYRYRPIPICRVRLEEDLPFRVSKSIQDRFTLTCPTQRSWFMDQFTEEQKKLLATRGLRPELHSAKDCRRVLREISRSAARDQAELTEGEIPRIE